MEEVKISREGMEEFFGYEVIPPNEGARFTWGRDGSKLLISTKRCASSLAPFFLPAGERRCNERVLHHDSFRWLPVDIDEVPGAVEELLGLVGEILNGLDFALVAYTTWSCADGKVSLRVLIPLKEPVTHEELCHLWWWLRRQLLDGGLPESSKELSADTSGTVIRLPSIDPRLEPARLYYLPSMPEDKDDPTWGGTEPKILTHPGPPLQLSEVLEHAKKVQEEDLPQAVAAYPGLPFPGKPGRAPKGRAKRTRSKKGSARPHHRKHHEVVRNDDLEVNTAIGRRTVRELFHELRQGERLDVECPWATQPVTMGAMFVVKQPSGLGLYCTSTRHGHAHAEDGCTRWAWYALPPAPFNEALPPPEKHGDWAVSRCATVRGHLTKASPTEGHADSPQGKYLPDLSRWGLEDSLADGSPPTPSSIERTELVDSCRRPKRIMYLDAPMGSGKGWQSARMLSNEGTALAIVHRRSLAKSLALRLDFADYREHDGRLDQQRLVVCMDSLLRVVAPPAQKKKPPHRERPRSLARRTILIDESEQVFRHLFGETVGEKSQRIYERLRALLRDAEFIVVADAQMSRMTPQFLQRLLGDDFELDEVWVRMPMGTAHKRRWVLHESEGSLRAQIHEDWKKGDKLAIAVRGKKESAALAEQLRELRPDARIGLFNSDTSEARKDDISKLGTAEEPVFDALIYTPTLGSGVSIEETGHYDRCYLFAYAQTGTWPDALQMTHRVRSPKEEVIHAWVSRRPSYEEEDPHEIADLLLELRKENSRVVIRRTGPGSPNIPINKEHFDQLCEVAACEAASSNLLHHLCVSHLEHHDIPYEWSDRQDLKAIKDANAKARETRKLQKLDDARRIASASPMSLPDAQEVKRRGPASVEEDAAAEHTLLRHFFGPGIAIDAGLVAEEDRGKLRTQALRYALLTRTIDRGQAGVSSLLMGAERDDALAGIRMPEHPRAFAEHARSVLQIYGIEDPRRNRDLRRPPVEKLKELLEQAPILRKALGVTIRRNFLKEPMRLATELLRSMGIETVHTRNRAANRHSYAIKRESVERMERLSARLRERGRLTRRTFNPGRSSLSRPTSRSGGRAFRGRR